MLQQEHSMLDNSLARKKNFFNVKQVIHRQNDTELHLAARQGDLAAVKQILAGIDSQITGTVSNENFDTEVAKLKAAMVYEENELRETALYIAAERGYLDVVKEFLKYCSKECITKRNLQGLDAFHVAAIRGHHAIVQVLLEHGPSLILSTDFFHTTALASAAKKGHKEVVEELLEKDCNLVKISRSDGENALHLATRNGHVEVVKALLKSDPQLARRTDKKGQTALHMAVKGQDCELVKLLIEVDAALLALPDLNGNTALHTATRKNRHEIVKELLIYPEVNVNALNGDKKTALDITEELGLKEIKDCLLCKGTVYGKEFKRMLQGCINNTASASKAAILIAQLAFAAIFTIPGGNDHGNISLVMSNMSIKVLVIFNSIAFFASLAVIVIQIDLSRGVQQVEVLAAVTDITAILIWLASVCISVVFMTATFVVVGRHFEGVTILITITGGVIFIGSLCMKTYYEMKLRRTELIRKKVK